MRNNLHYVKIKRDKIGVCNICGKESKLSWDHVPPKGAIIYDDVIISSISNNFIEVEKPPRELSQNGMKFRTICSDCNSLVGSKYDSTFNDFIHRLCTLIEENLGKLMTIEIDVDIELLLKSIFAHMLSAKSEIEHTVPDTFMREYLLNNKDISNINIHYWFYPFAINQVIRDILISKISSGNSAFLSILKLYPIAFLVTDSNMYSGLLPRLNDFYNNFERSKSILQFDLTRVFDYRWPLISDNDTIFAGGQSINSSVIAIPRVKGNIK